MEKIIMFLIGFFVTIIIIIVGTIGIGTINSYFLWEIINMFFKENLWKMVNYYNFRQLIIYYHLFCFLLLSPQIIGSFLQSYAKGQK